MFVTSCRWKLYIPTNSNITRTSGICGDSDFIVTANVRGSTRQVVGYSTDATFTQSITAGQFNTIDDMAIEITLNSASNKVLVTFDLTGEFGNVGNVHNSGIAIQRHSGNYAGGVIDVAPGQTSAGYHNTPGSRNYGITTPVLSYGPTSNNDSTPEKLSIINFLDSPNTTGIVTYYPTIYPAGTDTWYGNRTVADLQVDDAYERFISYITLQEIVG